MTATATVHTGGRLKRWLGWTRAVPTVAIDVADDHLDLLCLREGPVITASGRFDLPRGAVDQRRIRRVEVVADALAALRRGLHVPDTAGAVVLARPRWARVDGDTVVAGIDRADLKALEWVADGAGSTSVDIEPVPAALSRLAGARHRDGPSFADGGGWRTYRHGDHVEVEPSDRDRPEVEIGPTPTTRKRLTTPSPAAVDRGVELLEPWGLLLGAALRGGGLAPQVRIEALERPPSADWVAAQIDLHRRAGVGHR